MPLFRDADLIKKKGNDAFVAKDFDVALELYNHALKLNPTNGIYLLNRCFVYIKLNRWVEAEQDASDALSSGDLSDMQKSKAFLRRAKARRHQGEESKELAQQDFEAYLAISEEKKTLTELEADSDSDVGVALVEVDLSKRLASLRMTPNHPFEIKSNGLVGDGAFAIRSLKRGELILEEIPLVPFEDEPSSEQIRRAMEGLSPTQICEVLSLYNAHPVQSMMGGVFSEIYATNGFASAGICILVSRFNHSCSPNARASFHDATRRHRIYALTDIAPGEEIFIPYIQGGNIYGSTRSQRRSGLGRFGFDCNCRVCSLPVEEVEKSDRRRSMLKVLYEGMTRLNPSSDGEKIISIVIQAITLLREEGYLTDADDFAQDAAHVCAAVSDVESAKYWARVAYEEKRDAFGEDSAYTIGARKVLYNPMDRMYHPQAGWFSRRVLSARLP